MKDYIYQQIFNLEQEEFSFTMSFRPKRVFSLPTQVCKLWFMYIYCMKVLVHKIHMYIM